MEIKWHKLKVTESGQDNNGQGHQQSDIPRTDVTSFLKNCRAEGRRRNIHS